MPVNMESDIRDGSTCRVVFGCGKLYLTINTDPISGQPAQVLAQLGKAGGCQRIMLEAITRLINMGLDDGKPLEEIIMALIGLRCDNGIAGAGRLSCVDAIANKLKAASLEKKEEEA
jgi:hypothetical protein